MPILIRDKRIDRKVERLAKRQRPATSKEWLVGAVFERVADLCKDDPRAWESIGAAASSPTSDGAQNNGQAAVDPGNPPNPASQSMGARSDVSRDGDDVSTSASGDSTRN